MKRLSFILLYTLVAHIAVLGSPCYAWSKYGHERLSETLVLQMTAAQQQYFTGLVKNLTKNADISQLGTWADANRDKSLDKVFRGNVPQALQAFKNQNTSKWHYYNNFVPASGASGGTLGACRLKNRGLLLARLQLIDQILFDASIELNKQQEAVLIAFQVHMLQDIHQPLHTFARVDNECVADRGGNLVCLTKQSKNNCDLNLHRYWDQGFGVFNHMSRLVPYQGDATFDPQRWINESLHFVHTVYIDPNSKDYNSQAYFSGAYKASAQQLVENQVSKTQARTLKYLQRYYFFRANTVPIKK